MFLIDTCARPDAELTWNRVEFSAAARPATV
jgi:hypothetical protein